jgi:hypothetical protein
LPFSLVRRTDETVLAVTLVGVFVSTFAGVFSAAVELFRGPERFFRVGSPVARVPLLDLDVACCCFGFCCDLATPALALGSGIKLSPVTLARFAENSICRQGNLGISKTSIEMAGCGFHRNWGGYNIFGRRLVA